MVRGETIEECQGSGFRNQGLRVQFVYTPSLNLKLTLSYKVFEARNHCNE
jgi:hypothetical protein